jgi:ATP/maltotriose-dependent transcriptional regulator MalT
MVTVMRAAMAHNRGAIAELGETSATALELFSRNGDLWGISLSKQMRAEWLVLDGRLEEALVLNDESAEIMRQITSPLDLQQQLGASIAILLRLGRGDEALERAERLLEEARVLGSSRALVMAEAGAALVHLSRGDADAAEPHLERLDRAIVEWPGMPLQVTALAGTARGAFARLRRDLDGAEAALRTAAEAAVASGDHPIMAAVAVGVGVLALDRGRHEDARRALDLAVALRGAPDPHDPAEAELRRGLGLAGSSPAPRVGDARLERESAVTTLAQILRR